MGKWHRLNSSDLTPFVEEEVKHLSDHMQKTYVEAQQALEAKPQELKFLEAEKIKIAYAIDYSHNALVDANEQLEKVEAMIERGNFLISKVGPVRAKKTTRLEQLSA